MIINTILWDVDDTLLDFLQSEKQALTICLQKYELPVNQEIVNLYSEINLSLWKQLELGTIIKEILILKRFELLFDRLEIKHVDAGSFQKEYQSNLGQTFFYLENSLEICRDLSEHYRQYIVTNGVTATQVNRLHLSGFDQIMNGIFISEQIGYPKPKKEFFEGCFAKIPDFQKEHTIIVGDSLTSDMRGGVNAGITTCWYNPKEHQNTLGIKIDYEINHLCDIYKILQNGVYDGKVGESKT